MTTGMTSTASEEQPRLLVFFKMGTAAEAIAAGLSAVQEAASKAVDLVDSLTWYDARYSACGNWDSWAQEAVAGRSYRHRRPYFDGFISVGPTTIGQGEARTLSLALSLGKPVYWLDEGKLKPVRQVFSSSGEWHILTGGTQS